MLIVNNEVDKDRSWFVYNEDDTAQAIALASGSIKSNGGTACFNAPANSNGLYTVVFKRNKGGGAIRAAAIGNNTNKFAFDGQKIVIT